MADALTHRGLQVTLVGQLPAVMPTVDIDLGTRISAELERHGVNVVTGTAVERIEGSGGRLVVTGSKEFRRQVDLVLVAVDVRPAVELAYAAGVETGVRRAIRVRHVGGLGARLLGAVALQLVEGHDRIRRTPGLRVLFGLHITRRYISYTVMTMPAPASRDEIVAAARRACGDGRQPTMDEVAAAAGGARWSR
jgi:Pyridine nucleotide-disulphide oxidoreductase